MDLTTLAKVKAFLELTETDWDDLLAEIISAVSKRAGTYCNREFEKAEREEYHDGGGRYLYLKNLPVAEIDSIYDSDTWEWEEADLVSADEYTLLSAGMVGYRTGVWPYGPKALKVTYTGGYDPEPAEEEEAPEDYTPIPPDLELAARNQVAYDFKRRKDIGLESISFPDGSIQKVNSGEFLPSVKSVLDRYRIRPHG